MKSRKVKAYQAHKRVKANLPLNDSDSDVDPDSFLHDDIEDFDNEKDDLLSTDDELIQQKDDSSSEEEVLPITDDEKEESDEEGLEKNERDDDDDDEQGLPNREAWGKKKSAYYSADFVDEDRGRTYREEDAEAARAEAEEAFTIQKSVYSDIKAENLGANLFLEGSEESSGEEENVNIASATKQEKMKYLKTETKVLEVCKEYKSAIREYRKYMALYNLCAEKKIRSKNLEKYIIAKNKVLSLYVVNLSMYMMLHSSGANMKYHPVLQRLASFKELLEKLKPAENIARQALDNILEKLNQGEEVDFCSESEREEYFNEIATESIVEDSTAVSKPQKIKKTKTKHIETENEKQVMELINEVKEEMRKRKHEDSDEEEEINKNEAEPNHTEQELENTDEKRMITYQIAKNKGLVPHRKKEYRNPRVRHRMKYRKANIRRKGQVRGVVKEIKRYAGEPTGININVVKSVKFK